MFLLRSIKRNTPIEMDWGRILYIRFVKQDVVCKYNKLE